MDVVPIIVAIIEGLFAVLAVYIAYRLKVYSRKKPLLPNNPNANRKIRSWKIAFIVSCLIIVVLGAALVWLLINPSPTIVSGKITYPFEGANVNLNETIRGISQNIPEGQEIWVVVKLGGYRYYPAERPADVQTGGDWSSFVWIGEQADIGRQFDIIMVQADKNVQDTFNVYVVKSSSTGIWTGIESLPESAKVLDSITVTRK